MERSGAPLTRSGESITWAAKEWPMARVTDELAEKMWCESGL